MKYVPAFFLGIVVSFIGLVISATIFQALFFNGSVESSFHAVTQGLLLFLIVVIVVCTSLVLEAIKNIKTKSGDNSLGSSTTTK